jgi:hypothetical protein
MTKPISYKLHRFPPEIIAHAFKITEADWETHIPAYSPEDDLCRELPPLNGFLLL